MLFNSYEFILVFLPITAIVYFGLGAKGLFQTAIGWLVLASLVFYGWWNPAYLLLLFISILVNFTLGINLQKQFGKDSSQLLRKITFVAGIAFNLGLLGYFKYANFFADNFGRLTGTDYGLEKILLPLAISFFTFQQIAFLADARKGEIRDLSFLHYCLFVTFFPQLIAGPIVHHRYVLPQFANPQTFHQSSAILWSG
jgi:alginate O-acetyltransferase complex protein AlgI